MKTKKELYTELEKRTFDFFRSLDSKTDVCINDYIYTKDVIDINNLESFDSSIIFEEITNLLEENGAFNLEIIYYSNAIDYLKENDPSLSESLEIATEYGYETQNLDSEILASLLYAKNETEKYYNLESDITSFFEEIEEEINTYLDNE